MKILVFEFITGGGMLGESLPEGLAREGDAMAQALCADLLALGDVDVIVSRDPRMPVFESRARIHLPLPRETAQSLFARLTRAAAAVWPIAPETSGVLEGLSREVLNQDRVLLGCHPESIRIAASKRLTALCLRRAGIPVVPTFDATEALPDIAGPWVVKPDDGAGCAETFVARDASAAGHMLDAWRDAGFVAQPWIEGEPLSLSLICGDARARLLSVNQQHVSCRNGQLSLDHVSVNIRRAEPALHALANAIAAALPGLFGYVGVDLADAAGGPVVIEVNPRLTSAYCGLSAAIGLNPAELVLDLAREGRTDVIRRSFECEYVQ